MRLVDMLMLWIWEDCYVEREIVSGVGRDVRGKVESGDDGEVGL